MRGGYLFTFCLKLIIELLCYLVGQYMYSYSSYVYINIPYFLSLPKSKKEKFIKGLVIACLYSSSVSRFARKWASFNLFLWTIFRLLSLIAISML